MKPQKDPWLGYEQPVMPDSEFMETDSSSLIDHFVYCPLSIWPPQEEMSFPRGLSVKRLDESAKEEFSRWNDALSGQEIDNLRKTEFWIAHCYSDQSVRDWETEERATSLVTSTALALQIVAPLGGHWVVFICRHHSKGGLLAETLSRPPEIRSTLWARKCGFPGLRREDFLPTVCGVHNAFEHKIVRVQNAVQLFEHGLQSSNLHIRVLLWVMALDVLLMAENRKNFPTRLGNFLGDEALVFPAVPSIGQPKYRVADVASDLYKLRGEIAHGSRISQLFMKPVEFLGWEDAKYPEYRAYQYRQLLEEAALFLLRKVLLKVFQEDLVDRLSNPKEWRRVLENPNP